MNKYEELEFFKKYGICPYVSECFDSNGCDGKRDDFELCRMRAAIRFYNVIKEREKVQFT